MAGPAVSIEPVPRCFVCCHPGGKDGKQQLVDVTRLLAAHRKCFVLHQCHTVLNTGKEEQSPANDGKWKYDWQSDVPGYVKPEFAAAVAITLAKRDTTGFEPPSLSDEMMKRLRGVAREGVAAFAQAAMIL